MKVEIELPEIEGYEYTGEYRVPRKGEYTLGFTSLTVCSIKYDCSMNGSSHILKKVKPSLIGMLCEGWDGGDGDKYIALITEVNSEDRMPYMDARGTTWRHAKPLSASPLSHYLVLAREYEKH